MCHACLRVLPLGSHLECVLTAGSGQVGLWVALVVLIGHLCIYGLVCCASVNVGICIVHHVSGPWLLSHHRHDWSLVSITLD